MDFGKNTSKKWSSICSYGSLSKTFKRSVETVLSLWWRPLFISIRRPAFHDASFHPGENKGDGFLDLEQRRALLTSKPSSTVTKHWHVIECDRDSLSLLSCSSFKRFQYKVLSGCKIVFQGNNTHWSLDTTCYREGHFLLNLLLFSYSNNTVLRNHCSVIRITTFHDSTRPLYYL